MFVCVKFMSVVSSGNIPAMCIRSEVVSWGVEVVCGAGLICMLVADLGSWTVCVISVMSDFLMRSVY